MSEAAAPTAPDVVRRCGRWMCVEYLGRSRRTYAWSLRSYKTGAVLGEIRWYGPWRCYAFEPNANVIFNAECLRDIAGFLKRVHDLRVEP